MERKVRLGCIYDIIREEFPSKKHDAEEYFNFIIVELEKDPP